MSRWRHLTVAIGLIPALIIYIGLVMQIADLVTNIHLVLDFAFYFCLLYTSPSPRDRQKSRMPSSA